MKERLNTIIGRRDLLSFAIAGAGAAAASTVVPERAAAKPVDLTDKRKPRYRASSTLGMEGAFVDTTPRNAVSFHGPRKNEAGDKATLNGDAKLIERERRCLD
jgi:hypothetical protein